MHRPTAIAILLTALQFAAPASAQAEAIAAEPAVDLEAPEPPALEPDWLPAAGALVPGLLVHGSGHMIGGDVDGGLKLLAIEGLGLGLVGAGLAPIVTLGASRKVIGPAYALTLAGLGLFSISGAADLYGAIFSGRPAGAPEREHPWLSLRADYTWVHDPRFATGNLLGLAATGWLWGVRLEPKGLFALDADQQHLRLDAAWRIIGPAGPSCGPAADGTFLELSAAADYQRHAEDGFAVLGLEVFALGRYDMGRLLPSLTGSFAELGLGWGIQLFDYRALDSGLGQDAVPQLLMRFGYGIYLGAPGRRWGEVRFFYDHRHDDLAGGLSLGFAGDGVGGHFGLDGHLWLSPSWGLAAGLRAGSAWVATVGVMWRLGTGP